MSLDLDSILDGWSGEHVPRARLVLSESGHELVQIRIDLGLLQMTLDGRPDGGLCHGLPSAAEFVAHEVRVGRKMGRAAFDELSRELQQLNFRRLAFSAIVDDRFAREGDVKQIRPYLIRALRDVESCLGILDLRHGVFGASEQHDQQEPHLATLIFNRARLRTQLRVVDGQYDEAVEEAMNGGRELATLLIDHGMDAQDCEHDPGVCYLRELERRVREQYRIERTLRERLEEAVETEDFEAAAAIRDELRKKGVGGPAGLPMPNTDTSN